MSRRRWAGILMLAAALAGLAAGVWLLRGALSPGAAEPALAIDVFIDHDAVYAVTAADLARFGWGDVDPDELRVEYAGEPHPFFIDGSEADFSLVFSGSPPKDPHSRYTPFNVYRIFRDGDADRTLRLASAPGPALEPAAGQTQREIVVEENQLYLPTLAEGRPWFWQQLAAPGTAVIEFDLPGSTGGEAVISIELFGATEAEAVDPDHHLVFRLNGDLLADERWDGPGEKVFALSAQASGLLEEGNRLEIEAPGDTGVAADIVALDRIAIRYAGEAGAAAAYAPPAGFRAAALSPDLRSAQGAAYLAIGDPALLEPLTPLLEHRQMEGLTTMSVPLPAVYDQFGGGLQTPEAIRSFLAHAAGNWPVKPRYVLLVGDWSYDPYGYVSEVPDYGLPSFFLFTEYGGETVSDVRFALLDGDDLPDVALGRIPARTPEQVETVVAKTLAFENASGGDWAQRVLAVADASDGRFSEDAARFLEDFGGGYEPALIEQDGDGRAVETRIEAALESGVLIFSYFGHGSLTQFGKGSLFTSADAAGLANGDPAPILVSITCLVGLFTHPQVESLSEAMLWNPKGGAVAALSATSLTLPEFQAFLSEALVEEIAAAPGGRLGDLLLAAQRRAPLELGRSAEEVLLTFLLFGDPALALPPVAGTG